MVGVKQLGIWGWGGIVLLLLVQAADTSAMPAFSRKYKTSCVTCHEAPPRLNAVGESYRLQGFRFVDDELYRKEDPLELGDEAYRKIWPKSIWPGSIASSAPISFLTKWIAEFNPDPIVDTDSGDEPGQFAFILPHEVELNWATPIGDKITAYGDMIYFQEDFSTDDMYTWLAIKAWIEFQDLIGPENAVNLKLGTIGVHTIGLYTARSEQAMSIQGYAMYDYSMPKLDKYQGVYLLSANIKSFESNGFVIQPQTGIRLGGFGKNWLYYLGVVNGNIINPDGTEPETDVFVYGAGRNTNTKDFYGGVAYKFGGLGFDGTGMEGDTLPSSTADFWRDDSLTLSLFGYYGSWDVDLSVYLGPPPYVPSTTPHVKTTEKDRFYRIAGGALWKYQDLTLNLGYMFGRNENPYGLLDEEPVETHAWFAEAHYFLYPWLIPYARYEGVYYSDLPDYLLLEGEEDREILTLGIKTLLRANISLQLEGTYYTRDAGYDEYALDNSLFMMLSSNF